MLAQRFRGFETGILARAQKVSRGKTRLTMAVALGVLCGIALARAANARPSLWQHQEPAPAEQMTRDVSTVAAARFVGSLDPKGFPVDSAWSIATPARFDADWQGLHSDPERSTEVRLLWTPETLYLRFDARYRVITVFPDGDVDGRRDRMWDRDVCEAFLQPDPSRPRRYKEFEVAPNGMWIDLDIDAGAGSGRDLKSGLRRRVDVDSAAKKWRAVLALPINSITSRFDPKARWRANFYRVEGPEEPRFYSSWQPTNTPKPSFHVPESFGTLIFTDR
jgi:hypothetical protein